MLFACFLCRCRCWTGVRSRSRVGLAPRFASAAALQMCCPASCTSSTKATSAATRKAHTSWSSWWRTRPHPGRARRSSPLRWMWKKAPQAAVVAAKPTPGVLMTLNPWSLDPPTLCKKGGGECGFHWRFFPLSGLFFFFYWNERCTDTEQVHSLGRVACLSFCFFVESSYISFVCVCSSVSKPSEFPT